MSFVVAGGERSGAVRACFLFMVLLVVFLFEVDIEEFVTGGTLFNIASAVSEMCCDFALRELFETVITSLKRLFLHS